MVGRNTIITLLGRSLYFVLTFVIGIIIARTTGPEGKGIYSLVVLTASLGAVITGLGVGTSNACFVGKRSTRGGRSQVSSIATNSLVLLLLPVGLVVVFAVLQDMGLATFPISEYIGVGFAIIPVALLITLFSEILHGMNKILEFNLIRVISPCAELLVLLALLRRLDIRLVLTAWVVAQIIGAGVVFLILLKNTGLGHIDLKLLKESVGFGLAVWVAQLIGTLNLRLDMYLVAFYLGEEGVGHYSVAVGLAELLFYLPSSIAVALLPRFTTTNAKDANALACKGMRVALFSSLVLLVVLIGFGRLLVLWIYKEAFLSAVIPLCILLPGIAFYSMAHITTAYFNGFLGKPIINTLLAGLSLVVNIGLNILLIPLLGVNGAAISCVAGYILAMCVCLIFFKRFSGATTREMLLIRTSDLPTFLK